MMPPIAPAWNPATDATVPGSAIMFVLNAGHFADLFSTGEKVARHMDAIGIFTMLRRRAGVQALHGKLGALYIRTHVVIAGLAMGAGAGSDWMDQRVSSEQQERYEGSQLTGAIGDDGKGKSGERKKSREKEDESRCGDLHDDFV